MEALYPNPGSTSRPAHKRNLSSGSPSTSRLPLSKFHSHGHSRSMNLQSAPADNVRQASSSLAAQSPANANSRPKKASRIMSSVRKSLFVSYSPPQKKTLSFATGMYSTPAERTIQHSARLKKPDPSSSPPSVEQIAMGLHISRTPHLRAPSVPQHPYSQRIPLPPPPSRSALKKPGQASSSAPSLDPPSASSTTVTSSNFPSTPRSNRSLFSLKTRMSRFIPGSGLQTSSALSSSSPSPPFSSSRDSSSDIVPPKKAVRFSKSTLGLNEQED
ncbi:hypothetical protein GYMLUDRAFT_42738 [Collybiopsis luxurians FD-317 M1]|uniref:Uncharacterized protein n=1 Tax=Collybiopsis luxurians FD-317 M1 TaxID=944289 RepID=A0A0D0CYZ8_9AGAR|nr:hypothetical protein GYMLUDRAFT_42738 [Collybiopsis luxurians FD-317 M1]